MDSDNQDYFDFTTRDELPEEHSQEMIRCPHCEKPVPKNSLFCLYCGESIAPIIKKDKWVVIVIILVLVAFALWIFIL